MSKIAMYVTSTGQIVQCFLNTALTEVQQILGTTNSCMVVAPEVNESTHYILNGVATTFPAKPNSYSTWIWSSHSWGDVKTRQERLAQVRIEKTEEINNARLTANQSSFPYMGKFISTDALSRSDIDAITGIVSLTGNLPPSWSGYWKCTDNTYLAVPDKAAWIALYSAMVEQGNANFLRAQALKAYLASDITILDALGINWSTVIPT